MSNKLRNRKKVGLGKQEIIVVLPLGNKYPEKVEFQIGKWLGEQLTACYPKAGVLVATGEEADAIELTVSKGLNFAEVEAKLLELIALGVATFNRQEIGIEGKIAIVLPLGKKFNQEGQQAIVSIKKHLMAIYPEADISICGTSGEGEISLSVDKCFNWFQIESNLQFLLEAYDLLVR